ncbi:alpha-galactosidase [Actinomyces radicidentis]|uniref:alpha-galactosidase n=1 Tax=Actinomyces radicidentis TaxID=111015 RepID=UPI0028E623D6|nr:alpha-galactosidase [Actinomyces radicidentis]
MTVPPTVTDVTADAPATTTVHLRGEGTSLLLTTGLAGAPSVVSWGPDLGALDAAALSDVVLGARRTHLGNDPDVILEPGLVPGGWTGWSGRPGLVGHRPDGTAWSPRLIARSISHTGTDGCERKVALGDAVELGTGTLTIETADDEAGLALRLEIELTVGGSLIARGTLTNTGDTDYELAELSLALPLPLEADELLDSTGRWGTERQPQRRPIGYGADVREGRHGRTGFDHPTLTVAGEHGFGFGHGQVRGLHVAAPGNNRTYVERLPEGYQVMGGGELLLPGEVVLAPGESYTGPWLHLTHGEGLDEAADRLHQWARSLPSTPSTDRPVTLNVWEAVTFDHRLPKLLELADEAARLGIERYVLDDGWFGSRRDDTKGLGDWVVSDEAWPDGLGPLTEHVTALGMQFGLWFEPEMVNLDSDVARAHPEWILTAGERLPVPWRHQHVLNLTIPGAWEHVHSQMDALLTEYPISYIKWDHNRDVFDGGDATRGGRAVVGAQTRAALALMDRLRADHPGLEIESCSSGGGRIDLEMVRHTQRFWASDVIDPHERHTIVPWTEQVIPPERIGTHVASGRSQTTGRQHDLSFRASTALWGHMGVEWDLTAETQEDRDDLGRWIAFYKEQRGLLLTGRIIRDEVGDGCARLHGVAARDGSAALYELAVLERGPLALQGRVRLRGLDPEARYRVRPRIIGSRPAGLVAPPWFGDAGEGVVLPGAVLERVGLTAPFMDPDQAVLIEAVRV